MKSCPYCRHPIEPGDTICTACWNKIPPEKPTIRLTGIGGLGWVVIVLTGLLVICSSMLIIQKIRAGQRSAEATLAAPIPTATNDSGNRILAYDVCKQYVKARLIAPASAKFANQFDESTVEEIRPGIWQINSFVDSQNSFGAMLRLNFVCTLEYSGDESYKLVSLTLDE